MGSGDLQRYFDFFNYSIMIILFIINFNINFVSLHKICHIIRFF
jgi:hypothetical protein